MKRNQKIDFLFQQSCFLMACLASSFILIIILFIFIKGVSPFLIKDYNLSFIDFLFGNNYRVDKGVYGIGFIIINTLVCSFVSLLISLPISILTALYIVKVASTKVAYCLETVIELLASIPSVVYGVFGAIVLTRIVKFIAGLFGIVTAGGNSMLAVILVLTIMILPITTSISVLALKMVSPDLEQASLALGATKAQTNFKVILKSAMSAIFVGAILGLGRSLGEATAISMVAGNKLYGPTFNFFDITRTLTSTMLTGLKESSGLDYDIRFSIGMILLLMIVICNLSLKSLKKKLGK